MGSVGFEGFTEDCYFQLTILGLCLALFAKSALIGLSSIVVKLWYMLKVHYQRSYFAMSFLRTSQALSMVENFSYWSFFVSRILTVGCRSVAASEALALFTALVFLQKIWLTRCCSLKLVHLCQKLEFVGKSLTMRHCYFSCLFSHQEALKYFVVSFMDSERIDSGSGLASWSCQIIVDQDLMMAELSF